MKFTRRLLAFFTSILLLIALSATVSAAVGLPETDDNRNSVKGYYIWVQIEDKSSDGEYSSCNNSAGYIVIPLTNGLKWYAPLPAGTCDHENKTWTFAYGNGNCFEGSIYDREFYNSIKNKNTAMSGFPTEVRFTADNSINSDNYIKSNNMTYVSKWEITVFASGNLDKSPELVQRWEEKTIAHGSWSDTKLVDSSRLPKRSQKSGVVGPTEITLPDEGQTLNVNYTFDIYDQYNAIMGESVDSVNWGMAGEDGWNLYELPGIKKSSNVNGPHTYQVTFTLDDKIIKNVWKEHGARHQDGKVHFDENNDLNILMKWPTRQFTLSNYDGTLLEGPNTCFYMEQVDTSVETTPTKPSNDTHHFVFDKFEADDLEQGRVRYNTDFKAVYNAEEHNYVFDTQTMSHICSTCGHKIALSDKLNGNGTELDPWMINSLEDWTNLKRYVEATHSLHEDVFVALGNDISGITADLAIAAGDTDTFSGTFDGRGHSISLDVQCIKDFAPIMHIKNATIKNLKVSGSVSAMKTAGLALTASGTNNITNCDVAASLYGTACSGYIGTNTSDSSLAITGCAFTGKLLTKGSTIGAGFVGQNDSVTSIADSVYAPGEIGEYETETFSSEDATFSRNSSSASLAVSNSYYTRPLGTAQGKAARTVTTADGFVTITSISPVGSELKSYSLSGIKPYTSGMMYKGSFLFGYGDNINVVLSHSDRDNHIFEGYSAGEGTLTPDGDAFTLTLPDADVKIASEWTEVKTVSDPSIIFDGSFVYDGKAHTPEVTVKDGDTVIPASEYTVSYSDNADAGIAKISINDNEGGYYTVTGNTTFEIAPKEVTLTWGRTGFEYDGKSHVPSASISGVIAGDICDVIVSGEQTKAGTYTATASLTNSNYKFSSSNTVEFTIKAPVPTVTPTVKPTVATTVKPTGSPAKPTTKPTVIPTVKPTGKPTSVPSSAPTVVPTSAPTVKPTGSEVKPSATPTVKPTAVPTSSAEPTTAPTVVPTTTPTVAPSEVSKSLVRKFVDRIYTYVLDREPEEEGAEFWTEQLYSFKFSGAEVGLQFIFSDEFVNRNTSNEEFVTILYNTFFGREPEEGGFEFWTSALNDGTLDRAAVANGFIFSQEWADTCATYGIRSGGEVAPSVEIAPTELTYAFVERMYTTAMNRASDEEGAKFWANELSNFRYSGEQVGVMFFLSEEMQGFNLSDSEYITRLYKTFMDREPEEGGFNFWSSYLADGGSRADVVYGFTRSEEFVNKCVEARILPY